MQLFSSFMFSYDHLKITLKQKGGTTTFTWADESVCPCGWFPMAELIMIQGVGQLLLLWSQVL